MCGNICLLEDLVISAGSRICRLEGCALSTPTLVTILCVSRLISGLLLNVSDFVLQIFQPIHQDGHVGAERKNRFLRVVCHESSLLQRAEDSCEFLVWARVPSCVGHLLLNVALELKLNVSIET